MTFKTSLQRDLDRFYKAMSNDDFNIRQVTKSALSQARAKLNPWAFKRLNEVAVEGFYNLATYATWYGFRLLAIDGTRLMLPNHESVIEEFGLQFVGPKANVPRSMAIGSMLYDVLNQVTLDAEIAPYTSSEIDLLMMHLDKVEAGDLLLLDRGYPCFWLLYLLNAKNIEFCVRLKANWVVVKDFLKCDEKDKIVEFKLPSKDREKLIDYPEVANKPLSCRLIKVILDNGDIEVLCTSLIDPKYTYEEFQGLYHCRWNEEEAYKLLKSRVELEAFSGKTATAVKQDFYAKIFLLTMCAAYAHPIEEKVRQEFKADENNKHDQKINRTHAIATFYDIVVPVFIKKRAEEAIKVFDEIVYKTREIIRPNRSNPRPKRAKRPYSQNYKPI
jgi:hypothetical protein